MPEGSRGLARLAKTASMLPLGAIPRQGPSAPIGSRAAHSPYGAFAGATTYTYSSTSLPLFETLCRVAGGM